MKLMNIMKGVTLLILCIFITISLFSLKSENINSVKTNTKSYFKDNPDPTLATLDLYANIETIGVVVNGDDLPNTARLIYRSINKAHWHTGHNLVRIDDGRLVGSLFGVTPATTYNIQVLYDSNVVTGTITTQPENLSFSPKIILHVDDDALPGGDGSENAPFKTIQEGVNNASPGTQILVADGLYHESISFPTSGTQGDWIQVVAEGTNSILDGADHLAGNIWTPHPTVRGVWSTDIGESTMYVARDHQRFYRYDDFSGLKSGLGHDSITMSEGWFVEPGNSTLFVRSLDDPINHTWQIARLDHAFDIASRDWIWIEGFEMKFFGKEAGRSVYLKNASHVVIRRNRIHNTSQGIMINWTGGEDRSNNTRIEDNIIYDPPVNEWPWGAVKGTSMEGTAITVSGHIGTIVRGNELHHFFNGIYVGRWRDLENPEIAFDVDIYNNQIHHIGDDGLEPEGAGINQRYRNNTVNTTLVGISLVPITYGPTWILHNVFINYNGTSIKWGLDSDGIVLIYHNTCWTNEDDINAMTVYGPAHNSVMRNNIFYGNSYAFESSNKGSTGQDWNFDNWYTTRGLTGPHFKWENKRYDSIKDLCTATGLECNGHENQPGLKDPINDNFSLLPNSTNIDRGVVIGGINDDFNGILPDIGAYESNYQNRKENIRKWY